MADGSLDYLDPDLAAQEQQLARRRATAQMLLQQGMGDPGNQQYGGLRSAGSAILGAVLSRRADAQELSLAKQRAAMLGNLLNDNSSPSLPSPAQVANIPSAPMSQSDMEESQIPGGSPALISPQVSNTPTAPPQAAPKSKAQKLAEFLSILKGDPKGILEAESYQTPQAKSQLEREQAIAIAQGSRPTPEYLGQQAGAEAAGRLPSEIALKGAPSAPTPGMTPEALAQQQALKQTPAAPEAPKSPERQQQDIDLERERIKAQMGSEEALNSTAQLIANYQAPPLSSFAMKGPQGAEIMRRVMSINPDFRAQNYNQSNRAQIAFGSGKQADQVRSINVGIQHLSVLQDLIGAMKNGDIQVINAAKNRFQQAFGSAAPTNAQQASAFVGDEIVKAIIGSGGAISDRQKAEINAYSSSPEQALGGIQTYKKLLAGQMNGLKKEYESGTMLHNFEDKLLPETAEELGKLGPAAAASQTGATPGKTGNPLVDKYLP